MKAFLVILAISLLVNCATAPKKPTEKDIHIEDSIRASIDARIAATIEEERIKKENSLGIWQTGFYVDEFGDPTKKGYIRNESYLIGKFSNSATENSDLAVRLLISDPNHISIQLFEYAGDNPVKAGVEDHYRIKVKQDTLSAILLRAQNYDDRLSLNVKDSKTLSDMFVKGGSFKFSIIEESSYSKSSYYVEIPDATGFKNALEKLQKK
jgi:hypothetical protein